MLIAQRPSLSEEAVSDSRSRFTIEPLEPGFRLHTRQLAASYAAVVHPRRGRNQHQDRRQPARVLYDRGRR